jgi:integrase
VVWRSRRSEYLTLQRNPIGLIEIKGKSKRSRPLVIVTGEQWRNIIADPELAPHVREMMIIIAMLWVCARVSCSGCDGRTSMEKDILSIRRSYVNKAVDGTKTPESEQELHLPTKTYRLSSRLGEQSRSR